MAWIESHQDLAHHPKVARFAGILGVHKAQAVGHLHMFWWWCLSYADDGDLTGFTPAEIADGAQWPGDADEFVAALGSAGWVDESEVHDWYEYAGKLVERRRADAERKREARRKTPRTPSSGRPSDVRKDGVRTNQPNQPNQTSSTADEEVFHKTRALEAAKARGAASPRAYAAALVADPVFAAESERLFDHRNCSKCGGKGTYDSDYAPGAGIRSVTCKEPV